jgi:uncharacterized coiled-coil protein SlyX
MTESQPDPVLSARLTELEILLTLQQRTVQELNQVVIEMGARQDKLEKRIERLLVEIDSVRQSDSEPRDLAAEKPPHY